MATSLLKFNFKTSIIKSIISEISSNFSKYYYAFGKSDPWFTVQGLTASIEGTSTTVVLTSGTTEGFIVGQTVTQTGGGGQFAVDARVSSIVDETTFEVSAPHVITGDVVFNIDDEGVVDQVIDSFEYEIKTRNKFILYKQIDSNDVAPVIPRYDWESSYIYDMYREYTLEKPAYSGATSLENAQFYVMTDQYNVYKCLDNNNNSQSTEKPTGTSPLPITLEDGYIWKYMYTIPISQRNKFINSSLIPVSTSLTNQFYSKGSIVSYSIENPGSGYRSASYAVTGFRIISGGYNYQGSPLIAIEAPHQFSGTQAVVGTITITDGTITNIAMTEQGDGYSYPPQFTITGGDPDTPAIIEPIIENTGSSYVNLRVEGDGRLEENPYVVESIEIVSAGTGYDSITLLFTEPDLPNGVKAAATVTCTDGEATDIVVDNEGYGYSNPFFSVNDSPNATNVVRIQQTNLPGQVGTGFRFRVVTRKNEAQIAAIINAEGQIEQVKVLKPGIGYNYGSVIIEPDPDTLFDPTSGYSPGSILLDFGVGTIESAQSTVEITAVDGAIHAIYVENEGSGYTTDVNVIIEGDGVGAEAVAIRSEFDTIKKINIINPGRGYTYATARLADDQGFDPVVAEEAVLDVVLPPKGGHGKDAISELYAKTIMFHSILFRDRMFNNPLQNSFRQVCLVKNPKIFEKETYLRLGVATSAQLVIGSNTQTDYGLILVNDILTNPSGARFLVTAKIDDYDETSNALILTYIDNELIAPGQIIGKIGANFSVNSVVNPSVNKFSGEILTIDNRIKFTPSEEQIVVTSNTITF